MMLRETRNARKRISMVNGVASSMNELYLGEIILNTRINIKHYNHFDFLKVRQKAIQLKMKRINEEKREKTKVLFIECQQLAISK